MSRYSVLRQSLYCATRGENSALGPDHRATLLATGEVLKKIGVIDAGADIPGVVEALIDPSYLAHKAG